MKLTCDRYSAAHISKGHFNQGLLTCNGSFLCCIDAGLWASFLVTRITEQLFFSVCSHNYVVPPGGSFMLVYLLVLCTETL